MDGLRGVVESDREEAITELRARARSLRVINGMMWVAGLEPRYLVQTFGLGNNHSGTSLFVETGYNSNISHRSYFAANQLAEAVAYGTQVAKARGDTKSLPMKPRSVIKVLIPDAIRVKPAKQHGKGDPFLNQIEDGIRTFGPIGGIAAAFAGIARHAS